MQKQTRYYLVDSRVLPLTLQKVIEAKRMLALGEAKTASQAAQLAGISRSAFYKYKDSIYPYSDNITEHIVTIYARLVDRPGVLSGLMNCLYECRTNIITINQDIPVDMVAPVSISCKTDSNSLAIEELLARLRQVEGVIEVRLVSGRY